MTATKHLMKHLVKAMARRKAARKKAANKQDAPPASSKGRKPS